MKTKKYLYLFAGIIFIAGIIITLDACKKDKDDTDKISQQSPNDNSDAESTFSDIYDQVENGYNKAMNQKNIMADCPTVSLSSYDTVTFPKILTIDFGSSCTSINGVERKGKIIASISGKYRNQGTIITVTFDNFYRNGNKVEGTKTITNKGRNSAGNLYYEILVENGQITSTDGKVIKWNSSRQREWLEGESTRWPNWQDDIYLITGSANGINKEGKSFTVSITKALRIALSCRYITSGTFTIQTDSDPLITVDYGNGNCDNQATITIKDKVYSITLR